MLFRSPFEGSVRAFQRYRRFSKWGYGLAAARERKIRGFSFNKAFSLEINSFACGAMVNLERREDPKSCSNRSGQTDCWNQYLSVAGKKPNPTLSFQWIKSLVWAPRAQEQTPSLLHRWVKLFGAISAT